jgi:hypothetical protein
MLSLPVDFRSCTRHACSDAPDRVADVRTSAAGEQATAFTHVVDRRPQGGSLFVQYWLYYPDSTWNGTLRAALGDHAPGFHEDDWESYQLKIEPSGRTLARASSHHGYKGPRGAGGWWTIAMGWTYVARGSHAGRIVDRAGGLRRTESGGLRLVPIETLPAGDLARPFAVLPPWRKPVYEDPERRDT